MSQAKMTPGPWSIHYNGTYGPWVHGPSTHHDYGTAHHDIGIERYEIASTHGPNKHANARAIACLPELIEAARRLANETDCYLNDDATTACKEVRRILARIDGGEK